MAGPIAPRPSGEALELARQVMERADALGAISDEPGILTRRYGTEAMRKVNDLVGTWMRQAGMATRLDPIGNLIGHYPPASTQPTFLLGSHLDTVRDAGKYDGPLGVLVAIACVQRLASKGSRLPMALEVAAFADEEGLRFHTAYVGSKAFAGALDAPSLAVTDNDGISLAEAIRTFGGNPDAVLASRPPDLAGYCEVHIEQGPVLEREGLPVGVVSAIAGQSRFTLRFTGEAGHAGTVPMSMRRDALRAAAEFIVASEALAGEMPGLVTTVGQIAAQPGASNVIPGTTTISLDVRHIEDAIREEACVALRSNAEDICARRGIALDWQPVQETRSVPCDPGMAAALARAIESLGYPAYYLPSGAGHDAVVISELAPIAMLFVRCKRGISHNPAESVEVEDVAVAIEVLSMFLESWSRG